MRTLPCFCIALLLLDPPSNPTSTTLPPLAMINIDSGNFFLSPAQLLTFPSSRDGIPLDLQKTIRLYGCELIQEAGILLRLPQVVMATGQVLFHRFFCKRSFKEFDVRSVAASCVWLAMKLEEEMDCGSRQRSRLRDVLNVFQRIGFRREGADPCLPDAVEYTERRVELLNVERQILVELGFVCCVEHPHKFLLSYLTCLEAPPELIQEAWNLANDSLRTVLCVTFPSNVIACGVIYAAARRTGVPLPESPPWWSLFDADLRQIQEVCKIVADIYSQPKCRLVEVCDGEKSASQKAMESDLEEKQDVEIILGQGSGDTISKSIPDLSTSFSAQLIQICLPNGTGGSVLGGVFVAGRPGKIHDREFRRSDRGSKRYKESRKSLSNERTPGKHRERRRKEHRNERAGFSLSEDERKPKKRCSTRGSPERVVSRCLLQTAA